MQLRRFCAFVYDCLGKLLAALAASQEKLSTVAEEERAGVRPWLQAFTATWVKGHITYGGEEIHVSGGPFVIRVEGEGLELRAMPGLELLITGRITGIQLS